MKRTTLILALIVLAIGSTYFLSNLNTVPTSAPLKLVGAGDIAPDFQLEDTDGKQVALSDLRGKVVLLNLWATWCPPCKEEMPSMERLHTAMAGQDFIMLAVNVEENARTVVPEFLKNTPYTFPVLYDDEGVVQKLYGVSKFPESFIINKDGTIAEKIVGPLDWASPKVLNYFKSLAKG
jgi:peroxiredoxin